jgi:uncharacterized protein with NAD-binding domain and iron-sulfur cluster
MQAETTQDVIDGLEAIIAGARRRQSRIGYFAALYRQIALKVQAGIASGRFADGPRMELLYVQLANRYFVALDQFERQQIPARAWLVAFQAAQSDQLILLQHLLLGINAHANVDLALVIADALVSGQMRIAGLEDDLRQIKRIVQETADSVQAQMAALFAGQRIMQAAQLLLNCGWPLGDLVSNSAESTLESLLNFCMQSSLDYAWHSAKALIQHPPTERLAAIAALDDRAARLGAMLGPRNRLLNWTLTLLRRAEPTKMDALIDRLLGPPLPSPTRRRRIAVLGGGIAALTALYELTDPDNPDRDQYDITVYQMGWRVGGKGASGRNLDPAYHARIEEHGLHIWFGFYHNAFQLIQRCYSELNRPPTAPLATWRDAFKPSSTFVFTQKLDGQWVNWVCQLPVNDETPGQGVLFLPLWDYVVMALEFQFDAVRGTHYLEVAGEEEEFTLMHGELGQLLLLFAKDEQELAFENAALTFLYRVGLLARRFGQDHPTVANWLNQQAHRLAAWLGHDLAEFMQLIDVDRLQVVGKIVGDAYHHFLQWLWQRIGDQVNHDVTAHWLWVQLSFFYANLRGAIAEHLFVNGLDSINELDYRAWLRPYAFPDGDVMLNSNYLKAFYDAVFAYEEGDARTPSDGGFAPKANFEAGSALRGGLLALLGYKGAPAWKMQAGMGDTVFAPLYLVLKARGVKFQFFHRVEHLALGGDGKTITEIQLTRQAKLLPKAGADQEYQPLFKLKGLDCWPSKPFYEQLVNGDALEAAAIDLESPFSHWRDEEAVTLAVGADYDDVLLGISLAALPMVCGDLIAASPQWRQMVAHVKTVQTQALQLWLTPTVAELGWPLRHRPLFSGYDYMKTTSMAPLDGAISPFDTWGDLSHLLSREAWPPTATPQTIAYFCSPLQEQPPLPAPLDQPDAQERANQFVKNGVGDFMNFSLAPLWPKAVIPTAPPQFRWDFLVDQRPGEYTGEARLDAQYCRANIMPSERYVLTVAGSSKYRLPAHDPTICTNLYLAGDWTQNGLNTGCIEAAVMSGRLAANAIGDYPDRAAIFGVDFGRADAAGFAAMRSAPGRQRQDA